MDMAEDDMPRYAKAGDEVSLVFVVLNGRHLIWVGKEKSLGGRFERFETRHWRSLNETEVFINHLISWLQP